MKIRNASQFQLPPEGEYLATVQSIKNEGKQNKFGREVEQLRFNFLLDGEEGEQFTQPCWANAILTPQSRFYEIASALLAHNPPEEIDTDQLVGLKCRVYVEHYTGQNGKERSKISAFRIAAKHADARQQEVPF